MRLETRHSRTTMLLVISLLWKIDGLLAAIGLSLWGIFFSISPEDVFRKGRSGYGKNEQLKKGGHARLLSTSMPKNSKRKPTISSDKKTSQFGLLCSNNSYSGARTRTRTPASRSASPPISAVLLLSDKITSVHGEGALYHNFA